tara:strand:+ start:1631 stop:1912 length:282 start_codon:yes stop_codon:yes gene_type:complete
MTRNSAERRALFYEDQSDFDPFLGVDVNEYLIEDWSKLTLKQRKAVWHLCQTNEDFDWSPIYEQIDEAVLILAETDKTIDLSDIEIIETEDEE